MAIQIAFQGAPGAYSEEAIRRAFEDGAPRPFPAFEDVFAAVAAGTVDRGLVPIENAVFGSVRVNYDHLRCHAVVIVGELSLRIRHCLMAPDGASVEDLDTVRSHPQALGQCRAWLKAEAPQATTEAVADTAGAARAVAEKADPSVAAVASRRAAERYGLTVLAPEGSEASSAGASSRKTTLAFVLQENVPGALYKSLAVFSLRELDLLKIESRPLVGHPGRYRFFLDVEGDVEEEALSRALDHLREITSELQILGSYPYGPTYGTSDDPQG